MIQSPLPIVCLSFLKTLKALDTIQVLCRGTDKTWQDHVSCEKPYNTSTLFFPECSISGYSASLFYTHLGQTPFLSNMSYSYGNMHHILLHKRNSSPVFLLKKGTIYCMFCWIIACFFQVSQCNNSRGMLHICSVQDLLNSSHSVSHGAVKGISWFPENNWRDFIWNKI